MQVNLFSFARFGCLAKRVAARVGRTVDTARQQHRQRYAENDAEAAGEVLHDGDADVIGVNALQKRQIVASSLRKSKRTFLRDGGMQIPKAPNRDGQVCF